VQVRLIVNFGAYTANADAVLAHGSFFVIRIDVPKLPTVVVHAIHTQIDFHRQLD
jgi:hypothetical protein